jgi:hypothetical protein
MTELTDSMHKLVEPWVIVLTPKEAGDWKAQDFPPLLDMLQTLVVPGMEKMGGGSSPSTRTLADLKALDLLIHIQDVVRAWLHEWSVPASRELKADTLAFHDRLETLWRTRTIAESEYVHLTAYPQQWATRIWDLIEPPLQVPLKEATCPKCNRAKWINENDEHVDNLLVSFREGGDVQAECRWRNCDGIWYGAFALAELGFHVGATVDKEALREMGIQVE